MAPKSFLFQALVLLFFKFSATQTIIGSSPSFTALNLPSNSPSPTKQTIRFWPSLPPRGRSDVPIRVTIRERFTVLNAVEQGQRMIHPTTQFNPSLIFTLPPQNLSRGHISTHPTASRPRTDTASLALRRALKREEAFTKGPTPPLPTLASLGGRSEKRSNTDTEDGDSQGLGSGRAPTETSEKVKPTVLQPTDAEEMAQYRPQAQTMVSDVTNEETPSLEDQNDKTHLFGLTTTSVTTTTAQQMTKTAELTGKVAADPSSTDRFQPKQASDAVTSPKPTSSSADKPPQIAEQPVTIKSQVGPNPNISMEQETHTSTSALPATTLEAGSTAPTQSIKTAEKGRNTLSTTVQSPRRGVSSLFTTSAIPVIRPRFGPTYQEERNRSLLLGHPQQAPHSTFIPAPSQSGNPPTNGTLLHWGDLSHTLAFAWELHVYGTASLFLLLFAGAALGLTLSPGANCPHRGALGLANALLFLAGGLRAALFFIDPYGTRGLLPRPAVTALYNLPLHLLVWAQASLVLLALRVPGITVLPSTLEQPPLVAVLTVLQCTLLLAADLLSPALSPVVPVTLQVLSLCWGLGLSFGYLCYVFPRIRCPALPHPGVSVEARRKTWTGSQRTGVILGKVLAICAVLGALCCGLHVHATLWLYGLLGDWRRFSWGWWLVHFCARLLELTWGFFLLLMGSWVFWRPTTCRAREEGGQDGHTGNLPSPGQSEGSPQRHTCWSKIVQSLRGKPCRKSDSNGVGAGGTGEMPNNWAGQERPGADISKSLIRNQDHEQNSAQLRSIKDSNHGRNHRGHSAERGVSEDSTGSLLRLQTLGQPPQRSVSGSLDQDRDTSLSFYEFDLRPPSPINLTRSIDEALHREHLLTGGSLFHPVIQTPSPGSGISQEQWLRRNSDPQLLSESSEAPTESSMPLGGSILSSVPSRQVTAPPTPSHQGHRWGGNAMASVPSSVSCPVSLRPSRTSTGHLGADDVDDTRPFITPDSERARGRAGRPVGSRSYLEVSRHDDSASYSSEIIDL
ncbi:PREDICTED: proline-rich transmembrane protein 3 [Cyprinodon variegatus]|uniref:Proline rich transmembrane protein 3 n=1 Tax=Cyprinodon variegatus TaxID=28743 RepID=A0A3Q2CWP0_CYPVA|nr:PREDICTED: proline-rich transmembrane protein 3 [Cyprinodon variegatus]